MLALNSSLGMFMLEEVGVPKGAEPTESASSSVPSSAAFRGNRQPAA